MHTIIIIYQFFRVCVVCISPSHKLLCGSSDQDDAKIKRIEFQIGKLDRTSNVVSGRFKNKFQTRFDFK